MTIAESHPCLDQLDALRAELADLAYLLDSRGRADAADITHTIAVRVAELRDNLLREITDRDVRIEPAGSLKS